MLERVPMGGDYEGEDHLHLILEKVPELDEEIVMDVINAIYANDIVLAKDSKRLEKPSYKEAETSVNDNAVTVAEYTEQQILDSVRAELTANFSDCMTEDELKDKIYTVHGYIIGGFRLLQNKMVLNSNRSL